MRSLTKHALIAALSLSIAGGLHAATVNISTETGDAMETEFGFRTSTITRGVDLAGSIVTSTFTNADSTGAFSETKVWQRFDAFTNGGVNGEGWSLFQQGGATVNLVTPSRVMTSLRIDLSTSIAVNPVGSDPSVTKTEGASLFDITLASEAPPENSAASTQGTLNGFPFRFVAGEPTGTISVLYSGAVNLAGAPALGDLYTSMFVDFTGLADGGFTGSSQYEADQDTLRFAGDLTPVSPVPLPAGLPLLVVALGALGLMHRRNRA